MSGSIREWGWPYTSGYEHYLTEGQHRPPPSMSAPALVWNLAIWPALLYGEIETDPHLSIEQRRSRQDEKTEKFFQDINSFLEALQQRGRVAGSGIGRLNLTRPSLAANQIRHNGAERDPPLHAFKICEPQSLAFTLWWQDSAGKTVLNTRQTNPAPSDCRIRVQVQSHLDHVSLTIVIDPGKAWSAPRESDLTHLAGTRRARIGAHLEAIARSAARQIETGAIEGPNVPEANVGADEALALETASRFCFDDIWREFAASFGFEAIVDTLRKDESPIGEVFSDTRSVVLADRTWPEALPEAGTTLRDAIRARKGLPPRSDDANGAPGFGVFPRFNAEAGEPNSVLKAYMPFVRRMAPGSDDQDIIACGVFDWRALYVGALALHDWQFERDETDRIEDLYPAGSMEGRPAATQLRQLFLSKGQPHAKQIGRIVDRVNAITTMRHFALRNWQTIRNASYHIRILGDTLDGTLSRWNTERLDIEEDLRRAGDKQPEQDKKDIRTHRLSRLNERTEQTLVKIGAELDNIGQGGSGRLLYVIGRATYFSKQFQALLDLLEVDNIQTWVTYRQFVERNLASTFDSIETTGSRLLSLRNRLESVTNMVQTSALIVQTAATQSNTETLRRLASSGQQQLLAMLSLAFALLFQTEPLSKAINERWGDNTVLCAEFIALFFVLFFLAYAFYSVLKDCCMNSRRQRAIKKAESDSELDLRSDEI